MDDKINYRQQWFDGEIEAGTLLDAIDHLTSEVERYKVMSDNYYILCVDESLENAKLKKDRDRLVSELRSVRMQRDVRAEACLAAIKERDSLRKEVEHFRKDAERYRWLRENASDAHMWNDESIDAAISKSS